MQDKRYEILDGLSTYVPMYIPISQDDIPFYSEGFVVQFYKSDGTSWVANFKSGWTNEKPTTNQIAVGLRSLMTILEKQYK